MSEDIKNNVEHIVNTLANGFDEELNEDGQEFNAFDYLRDVLDIQWTVSSDKKTYIGARILVAFGGPNIWINTVTNKVEGYWWADSCIMPYVDNVGLNEALEELFYC